MILTDRDNTMDYYDCGFTNGMSSNLASVRTTNDYSTEDNCIISSNPNPITLSQIDFLNYRIENLEKTVEQMKDILRLMNIDI